MEPRWAQVRKVAIPQLPLVQSMRGLCVASAASPPCFNFISSPLLTVYLLVDGVRGDEQPARLSGMIGSSRRPRHWGRARDCYQRGSDRRPLPPKPPPRLSLKPRPPPPRFSRGLASLTFRARPPRSLPLN